jgi:hypothetical protein
MKNCRKCGRELPLTSFYADQRAPDGHAAQCKGCVRVRQAKYRQANIEAIRAYDRARKTLSKTGGA